MQYVDERLEPHKFDWISNLMLRLKSNPPLKELRSCIQEDLNRRRELEVYLHAVRILGTTFGGVLK
jgi:hypothetical protein